MKKLTAIFFVLLLTIGSFAALAESEYGVNPWTDPASKIYVFEDYSGDFSGNDVSEYPGYFSFAMAIGQNAVKAQVKNGALTMDTDTEGLGLTDAFFFDLTTSVSGDMFAAAEGIGFYVKNDTLMDISVAPYGTGSSGGDLLLMMKDDAEGTVMVDMKGVLEEADPDTAAGHLCIPSGYEGYVMIPMTAMFNGRDNSDVTGKQLTLEQLGVRINGLMIYEPEVFLIDNFFFYGTNLPEEKIGDVKVVTSSDTPTDTPSAPASENPTDEPTDASTAGASATAGSTAGTTPQSGTPWGLIIGIAAAVIVVAVVIIVIVSKNKKSKAE